MASAFTKATQKLLHAVRWALKPPDYRATQRRLELAERNLARLLALRYEGLAACPDVKASLRGREMRIFSQNGEDGLILYLLSKIGTPRRRFVEFGIQDGRQCNAANLVLNFGWGGLMLEGDSAGAQGARRFYFEERDVPRERLRIEQAFVTAESINGLLRGAGVEGEIDLLSIDIDGNDYWLWKAIDVVRPRLVVIEYNASLPPEEPRILPYDPAFRYGREPFYHGASLEALARLGRRKGFLLAGCESTGNNAFFVRRDLAPKDLPELQPGEAYYPHADRCRTLSPAEQFERVRKLRFETDG